MSVSVVLLVGAGLNNAVTHDVAAVDSGLGAEVCTIQKLFCGMTAARRFHIRVIMHATRHPPLQLRNPLDGASQKWLPVPSAAYPAVLIDP